MLLGAQLYTVRDLCRSEQELEATLHRIAEIGYTGVQVSGLPPFDPAYLRRICDQNGLQIMLTHTDPARIRQDTAQVIADHRIMGAGYIGISYMPAEYARTPDGFASFLRDYRPAAEMIAAAGMQLQYHNHDFELARFAGQTLLEILVNAWPAELLGFVPDTFWLQAGGIDPAAWIKRLSGRVPTVHLKDMAMLDGRRIMTPVLSGNMNFPAILAACKEAGTRWLLIEQDTCIGSPLDCLAESYDQLHQLGYN